MSEAYTTVDSLHSNRVLLILVEPGEDVEELCLADLWDQLDHVVEDDSCLFAHLGCLVL